jgi:hypothetical protein
MEQAGSVDVVITTGGTGLTSRDSTYEAIAGVLNKRPDGFGELFRMLSFPDIGAATMMTRACAGTIGKTAVFSLPGSEHACCLRENDGGGARIPAGFGRPISGLMLLVLPILLGESVRVQPPANSDGTETTCGLAGLP